MTTKITKKQIEDKGKEEYTLWRQAKDKVNTLIALSSKTALGYHSVLNKDYIASNMEANNDRIFGALTSDDPADMLDIIGPGGGVAGVMKSVGKNLTFRQQKMIPKYPKFSKKSEGLTKKQKMQKEVDRYNKATKKQRQKEKKSLQKKMRNGGSVHQFKMETPAWSTGSKASKQPSNVKTYSKEEIAEMNRKLSNGLEL